MNYVKVQSSQIAEVGYDAETKTLGLKFPPNKKQNMEGLPGSEYHYSNVPPRVHRAMMEAESIGSYFGENIKKHPDLYPYEKVETENPLQPTGKVMLHSSGDMKNSKTDTAHSIPTIDAPSTALTIIDTMADDLLFTPGAVTDAQLAAGREWYLTEAKKYDITTEKSRTELKRFARPLQKLRTDIEARAKELTGATKRKIAAIDAEKRRLVQIVGWIEDEVLSPLTAWEQEEEERKIRLATEVKRIGDMQQPYQYVTSEALILAIAQLNTYDTSTMQEYKVSAESAIAASLRALTAELVKRQEAEAVQAELAKLRSEVAERAEKDRLAEVAKAAVEAAKATIREEVIAELKAVPPLPVEQPITTSQIPVLWPELEEQETPSNAHYQQVNVEAASALVDHALIDLPAAQEVIRAISAGLIPHVTITY